MKLPSAYAEFHICSDALSEMKASKHCSDALSEIEARMQSEATQFTCQLLVIGQCFACRRQSRMKYLLSTRSRAKERRSEGIIPC